MIVVKTRVENCNYRSRSVVTERGAVEYTRFIYVDRILNELSLAGLVFLSDDDRRAVTHSLAKRFKISSLDYYLKSSEDRLVVSTERVIYLCSVNGRKDLLLFIQDACGYPVRLVRISILGEAHIHIWSDRKHQMHMPYRHRC